jgi:putative PIN family toxin of toxin-antitoxin system
MQPKNKYRVVIDTNIFLQFLISKKVLKLDDLIEKQELKVLYCEELLNELLAVMHRPKLKVFFVQKDTEKLMAQLKIFGSFSIIKNKVVACRDPKEDFLLSLGKQGKADYIITNNKDLLMLETFEQIKIVTLNEFYNVIA